MHQIPFFDLRETAELNLYRLAAVLGRSLEPKLAYYCAEFLGDCAYHLWTSRRRLVEKNLLYVCASGRAAVSDIDWTCRLVFRNWIKNLYELISLPNIPDSSIADTENITGWEYVEEAYNAGQGLIIVSAHAGNYWHFNCIPAIRGVQNTSLVQRSGVEALHHFVISIQRARHRFISADGSLEELLACLSRGEAISMMVDRVLTHTGVVVDMFGRTMHMPRGHVWLAMKTGAPIVVCFGRNLQGQMHSLSYRPPLYFTPPVSHDDFNGAVAQGVELVLQILEEEIGQDPSQWLTLMWEAI